MIRSVTVADVIAATCEISGLSREDIIGHSRNRDVVAWRHAAIMVACELTGSSLSAVGLHMGGRDHTTVLWARISAGRRIENVPGYAERLAKIRERAPGAAKRPRVVPEPPQPISALPIYNDGRRATTKAGHVDRHGNLICNP